MKRLPNTIKAIAPALSIAVVLLAVAVISPWINRDASPPWSVFVKTIGPTPALGASVSTTENGNWILDIQTENFVFSDLCTDPDLVKNVGHAHIYSGEEKIGTAFMPLFDLGQLPPGRHDLRIMLRATDHRPYVGPQGAISTSLVIDVPDSDAIPSQKLAQNTALN